MASERAQRYRVGGMNVVYDTGESFWSGPVLDVSESGLLVDTQHDLPVGTRVTLVPDVAEDEQLPFEIQAEVVRRQTYALGRVVDRRSGLAFRLVGLTPEQIAQVRSFLEGRGRPTS
jgi:hypothetical protein